MLEWKKWGEEQPKIGDCFVIIPRGESGWADSPRWFCRASETDYVEWYVERRRAKQDSNPDYLDIMVSSYFENHIQSQSLWILAPQEEWVIVKHCPESDKYPEHYRAIDPQEIDNKILKLEEEIQMLKSMKGGDNA
ncbi:hypothetical protein [Caudoviricetes sp.]|nr:hypothetical protein [Caudoviricetes sp.]